MSTITLVNESAELPRIAIYKKPIMRPSLQSVAWKIAEPPPGGEAVVTVPSDFKVFARYSKDPNNPEATRYTTNQIDFAELTANFVVTSVDSQDHQASGAETVQNFNELVLNEVHVENRYGMGVIGHIQQDDDDIYQPQVITPGAVLMEDIRSSLYLAVVSEFTYKGQRLVQAEISLTETEILEGQTAVITGSQWSGWDIEVA
ncbi:hypothetical protein [Microbulbifer taiwanensis]|uniref:Uncharacterized protein n=1 Tax=Microbulbifer taiwanensis TaxID=986746 RepID=A0ABW1YL28_9GAMM|nr:hypothetical protein [Microbulbifer taiwanensis]